MRRPSIESMIVWVSTICAWIMFISFIQKLSSFDTDLFEVPIRELLNFSLLEILEPILMASILLLFIIGVIFLTVLSLLLLNLEWEHSY